MASNDTPNVSSKNCSSSNTTRRAVQDQHYFQVLDNFIDICFCQLSVSLWKSTLISTLHFKATITSAYVVKYLEQKVFIHLGLQELFFLISMNGPYFIEGKMLKYICFDTMLKYL
jgi:hypothetical protein